MIAFKKVRRDITCFLICIGITSILSGQEAITWKRLFELERVYNATIQETSDGGYVISGIAYPMNQDTTFQPFLMKVDQNGDSVWTKTITISRSSQSGLNILPTDDDGYIIVSSINCHDTTKCDISMYKVDNNLDILWSREYLNTGIGLWDVQQTDDEGFILSGGTCPCAVDYAKLIKTDKNGEVLWTKVDTTVSHYRYVRQTFDKGYIIIPSRMRPNPDGNGASESISQIIRTNTFGETLWIRSLENYEIGYNTPIIQTVDNGHVIIAYPIIEDEYGDRTPEIWIQKFDDDGNLLWSKEYESKKSLSKSGFIGHQTDDGGFIVVAHPSDSAYGSYEDIWLLKANANGDTLWTKQFGIIETVVYGYNVKQTSDGGYILWSRIDNSQGTKGFLLIKTDAYGNFISSAEKKNLNGHIKIFPNPTNHLVHVYTGSREPSLIEVYSLNGRKILKHKVQEPNHQLNLSSFQKGIYFITIRSKDFVTTRKIIKY